MGVSAVHAVKVADADQCRTEIGGNLFEFMKDLHLRFLTSMLGKFSQYAYKNCFATLAHSRDNFPTKCLPFSLNLEFQFHSVVGQLDICGQRRVCFCVRQIMANVGKESTLGLHPFHDAQ